jgi:hypothetical protein
MTAEEESNDFKRELNEKEVIYNMPMNSLSKHALQNAKQSNVSKRIEERYLKTGLMEFLEKTGRKR